MESALVKFLSCRQSFCKRPLDVVRVKNIGGGAVSGCFGNAYGQLGQQGITIVSGWLAEPVQPWQAQRQFTQHWWNYDERNREYFDTSPEINEGAIYILDHDIALFAVENNDQLSSCVSRSVICQSNWVKIPPAFSPPFKLGLRLLAFSTVLWARLHLHTP